MARRPITDEIYNDLVAAFHKTPENAHQAGKTAKVDRRTAKKAWDKGWPHQGFRPIRELIEEDRRRARAAIEAQQAAKRASAEKERDDLRKNAVESLKQEGQIVQFSRAQALQNLAVTIELSRITRNLMPMAKEYADMEVEKIKQWIAYEKAVMAGDDPEMPKVKRPAMTLERITGLAQRVASLNGDIVRTAHETMQMERLRLGMPEAIVGLQTASDETITMEEAQARISAAAQALDEYRETTKLTLIEGGKGHGNGG